MHVVQFNGHSAGEPGFASCSLNCKVDWLLDAIPAINQKNSHWIKSFLVCQVIPHRRDIIYLTATLQHNIQTMMTMTTSVTVAVALTR